MKKAEIRALLNMANEGHRLILTHYWVKGVYLVRITNAAGKRYPGGYVVVEDDMTNLEADRKKINWIIRLRNKVEELQGLADPGAEGPNPYPHPDRPAGENSLDTIKTPDLDLDDLELPTAVDLLTPQHDQNEDLGVLLRRKAGWPDFLEDDDEDDDAERPGIGPPHIKDKFASK